MSNTKKILHILLSLLIVIVTIFAPMRQANANVGVIGATGTWVGGAGGSGMVEVTGTVAGIMRAASLMPKPPVVAGAIIAGSAGAWLGTELYKRYGDNLTDWALDVPNNAVVVNLKTGALQCDAIAQGLHATSEADMMAQSRAYLLKGRDGFSFDGRVGDLTATNRYVYQVSQDGNRYTLDWGCKTGDNKVPIPATDLANSAISDANAGNADAQKLVADAMAAAATAADFANDKAGDNSSDSSPAATPKPADPATPFDPSAIIAAIQSLFNMLQGLLKDILDSVSVIKQFWDWVKDTANTWKDSVVKEYQAVKDAITKEYTDVRDWVYSDKDMPKDGDGNLDIPDSQNSNIDTDISFGGSCPANVVVPFGLPGYETNITVMDFANFCQIISTYLRPLVIALASYQAVKILAGQKE